MKCNSSGSVSWLASVAEVFSLSILPKKSIYSNAYYFMITFNIVKIRYLTYYNSSVAKRYYVHKSALNTRITYFYVLLTVHPDTLWVNDQLYAQLHYIIHLLL